ncbi:MAG: hypothetical protein WCX22_07790 [Methanoregula sp.]
MRIVKHQGDHAIIAKANPVKIFCTGNLVGFVRHRIKSEFLDVF